LPVICARRNRDLCHDFVFHIRRVVWPGNCATPLRNTPAHRARIIDMHSDSLCSEKTRDSHCVCPARKNYPIGWCTSEFLEFSVEKKRSPLKVTLRTIVSEGKLENNTAHIFSCIHSCHVSNYYTDTDNNVIDRYDKR